PDRENNIVAFRSRISVLFGLILACAPALGASAAERIYARYSLLERSISIESLEIYAKEGRLTDDLATYTRFFRKDQLSGIREGLQTSVELDALTIAQFLYTPIGERLLKRVSAVVRPRSGTKGDRALRSALILAAVEPGGLTPLNVLKKYPTRGIQVDLKAGLDLFQEGQRLVKETQEVVLAIESAAQSPPVEDVLQTELSRPGAGPWQKISYELEDNTEKRLNYSRQSASYPVDVYLPAVETESPHPVVVISHGLNSSRESFDYLAQHLVSHGFVVVVPEHLGSSRNQLNALLSGTANDVISRTEFLDRPLDVSFALDELERISQESRPLNGRLDFDQVGVIGQSFGGYTALALGGASLDFKRLRSDCNRNLDDTFNLSLLLQCLALRLEPRSYELADPRIKGVIALNPVGSSLFGPQGLGQITVPTLMIGGSSDTVSPLLPEQVIPYGWLQTSSRYFAMVNGGTHFSFIKSEPSTADIPELQALLGRRPDIAQDYLKSLSLAFLNRHVRDMTDQAELLTPSYGTRLSRQPLPLSIISDLPPLQAVPEGSDQATSTDGQPVR
ncbi:MAG: alpha/beta hydrolase, partial [Cyanobacteria bacterium P01_F01_bin.42]